MSVYPKPNSPYLQIDFQVDNVRYAFSSGTSSKAEAERIQARAMKEARRRSVPSRGRRDCTFDEAAYNYWDLQGQATRGAKALKGNMRRAVLMVGADTMCSSIDTAKMLGYRRELRNGLPSVPRLGKQGRRAKDGKFSPKNVNKYLSLVFTILNHAERVLKTNFPDKPRPSDGDDTDLHILEIVRPRSRYLKAEEERRLEATSEPDLKDMWKADLELGLREANLCELRWNDIDWDERTVRVELKAEGNSPLMHSVDISDKALEILKRRRGIHPEFVFTLPCRTSCWLDGKLRKKGEHILVAPALFYERMKEAWIAAGIADLIVHDFRRTAARRKYLEKDIYAAQIFLGHRDLETTADYIGLTAVKLGRALRNRGRAGAAAA
jgi:integrase